MAIKKMEVDFLAIKIGVTFYNKPYYTIIYHPINSDKSYEGYGTESLDLVTEWANRYFTVKGVV